MALKPKKKKVDLPEKCGVKELAALYAEKHDVSKAEAEEAIRNTVDVITTALAKGSSVTFVGLFSMSVAERAEKQGRNPKTGDAMTIPAQNVIRFKTGATLKRTINE